MVLFLGPVPVLMPAEALGVGRRLAGWAGEVVDLGARLPARIDALLDEVTRLLAALDTATGRIDGLLDRADALVADVDGVLSSARGVAAGAEEVVVAAGSVAAGASEVVEGARATSDAAQELLGLYHPMLERAAPLARRFVEELSDDEVESAIKLVDQLPRLTEHMVSDIMPILETFDRVGPDLRELLDTTKELRQAVDGIPGLSFLKRRGARDDDEV